MGWFDEQIRTRKDADDAAFEDAFHQIAGAVMGKRMSDILNDDRLAAADAIGDILKYYHVRPQEVPDNIRDMNETLEFLMRPYGIMRRTVFLEKGWYRDAIGAMLGKRTDDNSVVALIPYGFSGYRFFDRKTEKFVRITGKNEDLIDKEALAFYKPFPLEKMGTSGLLKYIMEQIDSLDAVMLAGTVLSVTAVGLLLPQLNEKLFSSVLPSGNARMLIGMAIFMVCTSLSAVIFGVIRDLLQARISTRLNISIEAASMMRILSLPAAFFKQYSAGELASRVRHMRTLASQLVSALLTAGLTSVFSLAYLSQISLFAPALVTPAVLITTLTLVVTVIAALLQMNLSRDQMFLASKESGVSYSMISGIQKIRLSGAEKRAFARWAKTYSKFANRQYNPPLFLKISKVLTTAITLIGTMAIWYAAVRNHINTADYYAFNAAFGAINGAFVTLAGIAALAAQIPPILEMVRPIMETEPEIAEDKLVVTRLSGEIELNNVTFRYKEDMPPILDNLSLKIRPGQYVAIVGKTGCGKSTLVRLMLGFETPQKGAVYYDGRDLKNLDLKSLRHRIGTVMQNGKVFLGDIFSNITISAPWLKMKDAWEAAEIAGLAEDIRRMPMGMNTIISEGSGCISGGQRQRLLIARAIAPKPKILIFDEATSALDNLTQKHVSDALDQMKCTRIVIAHRLSTIKQCDRIIVLEEGKIIEDGSYDQLIAKNGFFADLIERQRLDKTEYVAKTTVF